jgi:hypothetical protein
VACRISLVIENNTGSVTPSPSFALHMHPDCIDNNASQASTPSIAALDLSFFARVSSFSPRAALQLFFCTNNSSTRMKAKRRDISSALLLTPHGHLKLHRPSDMANCIHLPKDSPTGVSFLLSIDLHRGVGSQFTPVVVTRHPPLQGSAAVAPCASCFACDVRFKPNLDPENLHETLLRILPTAV